MEHKYGIQIKDLQGLQNRRKRFAKWSKFCVTTAIGIVIGAIFCYGIAMVNAPATQLTGVDTPASFHLVSGTPTAATGHQSDTKSIESNGPRTVGDALTGMTTMVQTLVPFIAIFAIIIGVGMAVFTQSLRHLVIMIPLALGAIFLPKILLPSSGAASPQPVSLTWEQRVTKSHLDDDPRGWYILAQSKVVTAQKKDSKAKLDQKRVAALGDSKYASQMDPSVLYLLENSAFGHPVSTAATSYLAKANKSVERWKGRGFVGIIDTTILGILALLLAWIERRIRHRLQRVLTAMRNSSRRAQRSGSARNFDPQEMELQQLT